MTDKRTYDNFLEAFTGIIDVANKEERISISIVMLTCFVTGMLVGAGV